MCNHGKGRPVANSAQLCLPLWGFCLATTPAHATPTTRWSGALDIIYSICLSDCGVRDGSGGAECLCATLPAMPTHLHLSLNE